MAVRIPLFNAFVSTQPPSTPVNGTIWIDTSGLPTLKVYVNGQWVVPTFVSPSPNPPPNPNLGDLWVDTSVSPPLLKIYNGSLWQEVGGVFITDTPPPLSTRRIGLIWVDTGSDDMLKVWNGSTWIVPTANVPDGSITTSKFAPDARCPDASKLGGNDPTFFIAMSFFFGGD